MQTECSPDFFGFPAVEGRDVIAAFDGGSITSDAGVLLLRETDRAIGLVSRFAACFHDTRRQDLIEHKVATLVGQRVFGMALGYEDLIDHDDLRHDPMMAVLAGKLEARREDCAPVAGKSTLNRLERSVLQPTRYHKISHNPVAIKKLFVDLFLGAYKRAPRQITIDLDATDDPLHGEQEGRFFHGYYDCYCYLPLYIFCGRHLLAAKLRPANIDGAAGAVEELARIVAQIREQWPKVRILVRGDSGFARDELMAWCEANAVDYVLGVAKNVRLIAKIENELARAEAKSRRRLPVDDDNQELESPTARRGQGRVDDWRSQPTLHCYNAQAARMPGTIALREYLLRSRRDGEPDQGMPGRPVCRSHLDADDAGQSTPAVVRLDGVRTDVCVAPHRIEPHRVRRCNVRHHPPQAAQDRGDHHQKRPSHQDRNGIGLPNSADLGTCRPTPCCRECPWLTRLTHVAATRNSGGIPPRPTGINFRFHENVQELRGKRRHDGARPQKNQRLARQKPGNYARVV